MTKLNLASGQHYMDGYINVDNKSMYGGAMHVDMEADIFSLDWEKNTVDEIILSHFAMYIDYHTMTKLVKRWYSWLVSGGKLVIETGDVKAIAQHILDSDDPNEINGPNGVMQLFGWESTAGHKWAWCQETLAQQLAAAGFETIEVARGYFHNNPKRDFLIVGTK
jgi:hypothetical protein